MSNFIILLKIEEDTNQENVRVWLQEMIERQRDHLNEDERLHVKVKGVSKIE